MKLLTFLVTSLVFLGGTFHQGVVVVAKAQEAKALPEVPPVSVLPKTPPRPGGNLLPQSLPPGVAKTRVLLAGDSWAQYMWDDGSHNLLFDRYGHADKLAVALSLTDDPGAGYGGPEYAVGGSEAGQWVDTANYPWIANLVAGLNGDPTIDTVILSIGGNDFLNGKSGGGWYKDMDLDVPGSEAAFLAQLEANTWQIMNAAFAVRPDLKVMISTYDYPNFNTGFLCFLYACPKRNDLSRDPTNDLITDAEINGMMVTLETERIAWANSSSRVVFDNAVGICHHFYGDGVTAPLVLSRPGTTPPDYLPFPGGNPVRPALRSNFRSSIDPIHLDVEAYEYKIAHQTEGYFFPHFRGDVAETFVSQGGANDGWSDGTTIGTSGILVGDTGPDLYYGIVSFDTSSIPDGASITGARFYIHRTALTGSNPFNGTALGIPTVDVVSGSFGAPQVEASDAFAAADFVDAGFLAGSASSNGYAVGVEIDPTALSAINKTGLTQFRLYFPTIGGGAGADAVTFADGDDTAAPGGFPTLAAYMGTSQPFLDVSYDTQVGVGDDRVVLEPGLLPGSPNPFTSSTSIRFTLAESGPVLLNVFDVRGRLVTTLRDEVMAGGVHSITWDGRSQNGRQVSSGVYFASLHADGTRTTSRLVRVDR